MIAPSFSFCVIVDLRCFDTSLQQRKHDVKLYFQLFSLFLKKDLLIPSGYPMGYSGDLATRVTYSKAKAVPTTRIQGFPGLSQKARMNRFGAQIRRASLSQSL